MQVLLNCVFVAWPIVACVVPLQFGSRLSGLAAQEQLSHGSGSPRGSARALSSKQTRSCCSCCENSDATTTTSLPTFWCASKAAPAPCCTQFRLHMPIHQAARSPAHSIVLAAVLSWLPRGNELSLHCSLAHTRAHAAMTTYMHIDGGGCVCGMQCPLLDLERC